MNSILSDVITKGTGRKANRALQRGDIKGKTGTTNDADIWFSGFSHDLVATVWIGFDDNSPVGRREYGSTTPIETWIEYMRVALPNEQDSTVLPFPDNLVTVRIDPKTGQRADPSDPNAIFELFRAEYAPKALRPTLGQEEQIPAQDIF